MEVIKQRRREENQERRRIRKAFRFGAVSCLANIASLAGAFIITYTWGFIIVDWSVLSWDPFWSTVIMISCAAVVA